MWQAARLRLVHDRPYLAAAVLALIPVERPGLGSMAVDQWGRLYYDPKLQWNAWEAANVLYHEVCHLLRAHHERGRAIDAEAAWNVNLWNIAADAEINDNLEAEGVKLPVHPVTPEGIHMPEGMLAEEYYWSLKRSQSSPPGGGGDTPSKPGNDDESTSLSSAGQGDSSPQPPGGPAAGGADGAKGNRGAEIRADGRGSPGQEGQASQGKGEGSTGCGTAGAGDSPTGQTTGEGVASGGGTNRQCPPQTPAVGAGWCGSCATGQRAPWEEPPPGTPGAPDGWSEIDRRLIARQVAQAIRIQAGSGRGNIPGHWRRWADAKVNGRVDWRRELAVSVRLAVRYAPGAVDYTYARPSRRRAVAGNVILPALRYPKPEIAVIVDTSESVEDRLLAQAIAEVAGILRRVGDSVTVLAVDAAVQECRRVWRPEQVQLLGGGGTDLRVGFEAALRLRPRPEVLVVLTDGDTPWPDVPPKDMSVIVGLLKDGRKPPRWAKTVMIRE